MRVFTVLFSMCLLLTSGCGPASDNGKAGSGSVTPTPAVSGASLKLDSVTFPGASELTFNGRLVRYEFIQTPKTSLERFIINSTDGLMSLDATVFAGLAEAGYTRRVRKEQAGLFVVNYVKKGAVTIAASYSDFSTKFPVDRVKSRAVLTWQVKD